MDSEKKDEMMLVALEVLEDVRGLSQPMAVRALAVVLLCLHAAEVNRGEGEPLNADIAEDHFAALETLASHLIEGELEGLGQQLSTLLTHEVHSSTLRFEPRPTSLLLLAKLEDQPFGFVEFAPRSWLANPDQAYVAVTRDKVGFLGTECQAKEWLVDRAEEVVHG